jgi:uncharacterized lipoprotein YmbA
MSRTAQRRLAVLACCLLGACSSSPPTRYYALSVVSPAAPIAPAVNGVAVRVEPVAIPPELDRLELVSHVGANRVHIAGQDLWAAPLDDQVRHTLSDDLSARLPAQLVADPQEPATTEPRRLLSVDITQLDADENCAVSLRAQWTLHDAHGDRRGSEQLQAPASAPCSGALPAAMSRALGLLADRLAAVIAAD